MITRTTLASVDYEFIYIVYYVYYYFWLVIYGKGQQYDIWQELLGTWIVQIAVQAPHLPHVL